MGSLSNSEILFKWYIELIENQKDRLLEWYYNYKEMTEQISKKINQTFRGSYSLVDDKEFIFSLLKLEKIAAGGIPTIKDIDLKKLINFENFRQQIEELVRNPCQGNLDELTKISRSLLDEISPNKKISNQHLRFNRICAVSTLNVSTIANSKDFYNLEKFLINQNIMECPNNIEGWYARNEYMVEYIHKVFDEKIKEGITDKYWLNIFLWEICAKKILEYRANIKIDDGKQDENNKNKLALNQIFFGPAGTGKTYHTINHALAILDNYEIKQEQTQEDRNEFKRYCDEGRIEFVTFHQSYGYEEFVEGIKVKENGGQISYLVEPGVFKKSCTRAKDNPTENYVLIIDEINRGNISKIFGELITLIEDSKRAGKDEALSVTLPYSGESFSVPSNLYIIGTMNSSDRSLTSLDLALRRRFEFIEMLPKPEVLRDIKIASLDAEITLENLLTTINKRIKALLDQDHCIGHANFTHLKPIDEKKTVTVKELMQVFEKKIIPLLQEYFFNDWEKINLVLGNNGMIIKDTIDPNLFPSDFLPQVERLNSRSWKIDTDLFRNSDDTQAINALIKIIGKLYKGDNSTQKDATVETEFQETVQ